MLIPPLLYTVLFYGGFVVGVVGLVAVGIGGAARSKTKRESPLPDAVIANRRPRNGVLWQLLGGFALIGGPAASIWLWSHHNAVVFVRSDATGPSVHRTERRVWIGDPYPAPNSLEMIPRRRATWIVNEASTTVHAQSIGYGDRGTYAPTPIPPGASLPVDSVDHLGPDDPPPGMVTVTQSSELVKAGMAPSAQRVWLTW